MPKSLLSMPQFRRRPHHGPRDAPQPPRGAACIRRLIFRAGAVGLTDPVGFEFHVVSS